jgi:transcriptional regulator with XRE-family HTH domain
MKTGDDGAAMLTPTLKKGLGEYAIGGRVRTLRLKKKLGLVELGKHTGLSPAMLSKIERGRLFPTLPTLLRIALVFGVGLDFFFAGARDKPLVAVVRRSERVRLPDRPGAGDTMYLFESLDYPATERRFNSYLAEFLPVAPDQRRLHEHSGVEFLYVLEGALGVQHGDEEFLLGQGDSMYFDATVPHAYWRSKGRTCRALVVTTSA